jgi:hypothetical protein
MRQDWKLFSWCGISFLIPEKWSVGKIQGDEREGSLRIDDPFVERIQLIWKRTPPGQIAKFVDRQIHEIEKKAQKKKLPLSVKRDLNYPIDKKLKGEFFYWKADSQAYNLCLQTGGKHNRVVFLRILGNLDEELEPKIVKITSSLKVERDSPRCRWALFGLDVAVPQQFRMDGYHLLAGHVRLDFSAQDQRLQVNKFSLGQIVLEKEPLGDWVRERFKPVFKRFRLTPEEKSIHKHPGLAMQGKRRGFLARHLNRDKIHLYAWFCPKVNNILVVMDRYKNTCDVKKVVDNVRCH